MDIFNTIIMWACCFHNTHSIVMTQYPTDIIAKYLLHVSKSSERLKEEALDKFHKMNITDICFELRETYVYQTGPILPTVSEPDPEDTIYPSVYDVNIDVEQALVQLRKFKIANLNQTLSLHSFHCWNIEHKPTWFVATAFVPHSAFLFEVEPKFRHLIGRQIKGNTGIPAKLSGIVDLGAFFCDDWSLPEDTSLSRYLRISNFTGKDKICDAHPILQFRLCALSLPHYYHTDRSINIYNPSDGGCKPVPIKEVFGIDQPNSLTTQEMLHCPLRLEGQRLFSIYVGLVVGKPLEMISVIDELNNSKKPYIWYQRLPIMKYIDSYHPLLKNFDVNL